MRKYKLLEKKVKDFELTSITCNKCGTKHAFHGEGKDYMCHSFEINFGYGSKFDEEGWKFDLCENCLVELVNSFVYKPEGYRE